MLSGRTQCFRQADGRLINKGGPRVRAEEFEALRHARQLGVPVPTVSEFSSDTRTIRMEYVGGELLEDVWPTLSDREKIAYAQQLGRYISLMRSDRKEKIAIGGINGFLSPRTAGRFRFFGGAEGNGEAYQKLWQQKNGRGFVTFFLCKNGRQRKEVTRQDASVLAPYLCLHGDWCTLCVCGVSCVL